MLKKYCYFMLIFIIIIIFIPLLITRGLLFFERDDGEDIIIKVYNTKHDKIVEMELEKYLQGVVAAEMPANYHIEALKAQAVAARTYTANHLPIFGGEGSRQYPGADICTDYHFSQAWISRDEMQKKWGFVPFFYFYNKISRAVEETKSEVLTYNGKLIDAVYHSNAGGITEDPYYVWGNRVPYLKSIKSPYDSEKEKNYEFNYTFKLKEIDKKLGTSLQKIVNNRLNNSVNEEDEFNYYRENNIIRILEKSNSGRIVKIRIGDKIFEGQELREKLSLPSNFVDFTLNNSNLYCNVKGYGHGVGMSQAGADGMAKNGYNYKEILLHYYQAVDLVDLNELNRMK